MSVTTGGGKEPTREAMEALGEQIAEQAAHLDAATHRLLTDLRAFDQGRGWYQQGARSCAQWLSWRLGWDMGTARQHVRVAARLGELPQIDDALRRGELSYSKVRAMTRVATPKNEATLLEEARHTTGAQLESICRKYAVVRRHDQDVTPSDDQQRRYVHRRETADGMIRIEAVLHPEEAATVWAALDKLAAERCRSSSRTPRPTDERTQASAPASASEPAAASASTSASEPGAASAAVAVPICGPTRRSAAFDRADALVALSQDVLRGHRKERAPVDVMLTTTIDTLRAVDRAAMQTREPCEHCPGGTTCEHVIEGDPSHVSCFADGTCISVEAARRVACDCGVIDVIESEHGETLSVGRKRRTIPAAMKRAMLRRDRTCRFPGCTTRVFLEGHHIAHWADGGHTALANLVAMCSHHHRFVHEYGYAIETSSDGPQFFDDRGRPVPPAPAPAAPSRLGWETIRANHGHLAITAETPACGWDGDPVDYDACIGALLHADRDTDLAAA